MAELTFSLESNKPGLFVLPSKSQLNLDQSRNDFTFEF